MNKGQEQSIHRKKVQMASRHLKRCQPPCQYDGMNLNNIPCFTYHTANKWNIKQYYLTRL